VTIDDGNNVNLTVSGDSSILDQVGSFCFTYMPDTHGCEKQLVPVLREKLRRLPVEKGNGNGDTFS